MLKETVVSSGDTAGIEGTNEYGYDASQKRAWKKHPGASLIDYRFDVTMPAKSGLGKRSREMAALPSTSSSSTPAPTALPSTLRESRLVRRLKSTFTGKASMLWR